MAKIACQCGKCIDVGYPDLVDLDEDRDKLATILSGDFLNTVCPECRNLLKPEIPMRIVYGSRHQDLFLVPEMDRKNAMSGDLSYSIPQGVQIVVGYAELVERLTMAGENLDARAVEILKYFLLRQAVESADDCGEIRIRFQEIAEDRLVFQIHGLRKEEVGIFQIPRTTYDKALSRLDEHLKQEPLAEIVEPPYISINKIYREA